MKLQVTRCRRVSGFGLRNGLFLLFFLFALASWHDVALAGQDEAAERLRQEEIEDYYEKWIDEDVVYIITSEERDVFESLTTPEEKEQFIEQFWVRRDPDLRTPSNEFKEEHYRRIAYANERFTSGIPGWKTDRGRIYIIHGDPVEIEKHRMGQSYDRPSHEGGGHTVTYPFEIWRYHHIEGIGQDVELEFVDPDGTGQFRLAVTPWEKDALLMIPGAGLTVAEQLGHANRQDHPYFKPYTADRYLGMHTRMQDDPFIRYERLAVAQQPTPVKYKDLKELVDVNISYESLPFQTRYDFFRLSEERSLVSIAFQVQNRDLSFSLENGVQVARVAVYGIVTSLTNRVVTEFEDDLIVSYQPDALSDGLEASSVYQKVLPLESRLRYRLDLIVKDLSSGNVGVVRNGIIPPKSRGDVLESSSLILSDALTQLAGVPDANEMFVLGDIKVRPSLDRVFPHDRPLWIYLQVYNAALDQSALVPSMSVSYRLLKNGEAVYQTTDASGESIQFFSGQRVVLVKELPISGLEPGKYQLQVTVDDQLQQESISVEDSFELTG